MKIIGFDPEVWADCVHLRKALFSLELDVAIDIMNEVADFVDELKHRYPEDQVLHCFLYHLLASSTVPPERENEDHIFDFDGDDSVARFLQALGGKYLQNK